MILELLIILQFIFCFVLNYGMFIGQLYKGFGYISVNDRDRGFCMCLSFMFSLFSIIGVLIVFLITGFGEGGLRFK